MTDLKQKGTKKERKQYIDQNPIEVITGGFKSSVVDDLGKASVNDAWDQLLGIDPHESGEGDRGDLAEGAELDLTNLKKEVVQITDQGREFAAEIIHAGKQAQAENSREIEVKMQEILIEIKKLTQGSAELQKQVEVISVEQTAENPGIYHVNFLEKMLSYLRDIRLSVEDSLSWFNALRSKKASRQYGKMAKKHGTSFTLSNERVVSTQTG